jgi:hypothetical protein
MHRTGRKALVNVSPIQMDEVAKRKDAKSDTEQQTWAQRLALAHPWANRKESLCVFAFCWIEAGWYRSRANGDSGSSPFLHSTVGRSIDHEPWTQGTNCYNEGFAAKTRSVP